MKEGKVQQIFKNVANLSLRGSSFDAHHLDRFLNSPFGERSFSIECAAKADVTKKREKDEIVPSFIFRNLPRDKMVFDKYVDLKDGPSSLQKRENI